jgi:hypothetical protein
VDALHQIHPEKVQFLGKAAIADLVDEAYAVVAKRGSSWIAGGPLFAGLMFTFGHGCIADPQYPWISGTLENARLNEASIILERLFQKFVVFLTQARYNLSKR